MKIWAQRISYVGELGYELYVKIENAKKLFEILVSEGKKFKASILKRPLNSKKLSEI